MSDEHSDRTEGLSATDVLEGAACRAALACKLDIHEESFCKFLKLLGVELRKSGVRAADIHRRSVA